jgi:hypothetical protein
VANPTMFDRPHPRPPSFPGKVIACGDCDASADVDAGHPDPAGWTGIVEDAEDEGETLWWTHTGTCPECTKANEDGGDDDA